MVVSFHELAERELSEAAQYYDGKQPGLGAAFIADVRRCTDAILEYPEAGPTIRGRVRRRLCRKFRYGVLYTIRPGTVRVLAVMNLRRHPTCWVGRS
jgi:toxin ParE1/3/4